MPLVMPYAKSINGGLVDGQPVKARICGLVDENFNTSNKANEERMIFFLLTEVHSPVVFDVIRQQVELVD